MRADVCFYQQNFWYHLPNPYFRAASLAEILHTATLVHDDVVDDAETQRFFFGSIGALKNKASVLVGDYLLQRSYFIARK